jgi:hypothetical protein
MRQVRAKFRCMEISRFWNGGCTLVRFLPVMAKNGCRADEETASEENAAFWQATPSGEAKLQFPTLDPVSYEIGHCYYLDMRPDEQGSWKLTERKHSEGQLGVVLSCSWRDSVSMNICNESAWDAFDGPIGGPWSVEFTHAGP